MPVANINDPSSLERIYPRTAFEEDAARNARGAASVHYGLKILSEPDAEGAFSIERMSQQVGENDPEGDTVFLAPAWRSAARVSEGSPRGGLEPLGAAEEDAALAEDYRRFLERLREVAKNVDFKAAIGFGDERLKGFRGG